MTALGWLHQAIPLNTIDKHLAPEEIPVNDDSPLHTVLTTLPCCAGVKYMVSVSRSGPGSLRLTLSGISVEAVVRGLNDGGLLIQVGFTA